MSITMENATPFWWTTEPENAKQCRKKGAEPDSQIPIISRSSCKIHRAGNPVSHKTSDRHPVSVNNQWASGEPVGQKREPMSQWVAFTDRKRKLLPIYSGRFTEGYCWMFVEDQSNYSEISEFLFERPLYFKVLWRLCEEGLVFRIILFFRDRFITYWAKDFLSSLVFWKMPMKMYEFLLPIFFKVFEVDALQ